jgi:alpha-L-fucosidase
MPVDLVIDLGKEETITGFKYLPDQNWWAGGIITNDKFFVSHDGQEWRLAEGGEFANIKNNPLWQVKSFKPLKGRYIKLQALGNKQNDSKVTFTEIDMITK